MTSEYSEWFKKPIRGVLLDISGVLKDGPIPIPGSPEAFEKLKSSFQVRLVTNETQLARSTIQNHLAEIGFEVEENRIFSPAPAMCAKLRSDGLRPYLFVNPGVLPDFAGLDETNPNCFVMGDAPPFYTFDYLNKAFQFLINTKDAKFFTLGKGKFYKESNQLMLDVGVFAHALEFATDRTAELVGKPSATYFEAVLKDIGLPADQVIMIGDDIVGDVGGAQNAGMRGILVRTGKYRPSDENHPTVKPDGIVDDLAQAVDLIFKYHCK